MVNISFLPGEAVTLMAAHRRERRTQNAFCLEKWLAKITHNGKNKNKKGMKMQFEKKYRKYQIWFREQPFYYYYYCKAVLGEKKGWNKFRLWSQSSHDYHSNSSLADKYLRVLYIHIYYTHSTYYVAGSILKRRCFWKLKKKGKRILMLRNWAANLTD